MRRELTAYVTRLPFRGWLLSFKHPPLSPVFRSKRAYERDQRIATEALESIGVLEEAIATGALEDAEAEVKFIVPVMQYLCKTWDSTEEISDVCAALEAIFERVVDCIYADLLDDKERLREAEWAVVETIQGIRTTPADTSRPGSPPTT